MGGNDADFLIFTKDDVSKGPDVVPVKLKSSFELTKAVPRQHEREVNYTNSKQPVIEFDIGNDTGQKKRFRRDIGLPLNKDLTNFTMTGKWGKLNSLSKQYHLH